MNNTDKLDEIIQALAGQQNPDRKRVKKNSDIGAKVYAKINGQRLPAVVIDNAFSAEGDYMQTRLKIAVLNTLTGQWMQSDYPTPVQSYKLTRRTDHIPALDDMPAPGVSKNITEGE